MVENDVFRFSSHIVIEYPQKQHGQRLPEDVIWKYFIQMACALHCKSLFKIISKYVCGS